jgi:hypothetical protein
MFLHPNLQAAMLNGIETFLNDSGTATLNIYQTFTLLCTFNLNATPLNSAVADSITATSLPVSNTGTSAAGMANKFSLLSEAGVLGATGTISAVGGGGDIEVPSLTVSASTTQKLNAFTIRISTDGSLTLEASLTFQ